MKKSASLKNWLPLARGWTDTRDLPAPQGQTFQHAPCHLGRQRATAPLCTQRRALVCGIAIGQSRH